jgi:L-2-hydroxyglutarate oxidase LhgO
MLPSDLTADITIIGAGIVGLATARALLQRRPNLRLLVLDKETAIGQHQTGRNSGVIHSGLYYKPGTLKAQMCTAGARQIYQYCDEHSIPYQRCGKVVVATAPAEIPRLNELFARGIANGVDGLELIGPERLREIEPHAAGLQAIYSPNTGIVDYGLVAQHYARDVQLAGGIVALGREVRSITRTGRFVWLDTHAGMVETRFVIACVGVYADRVAALSGAPRTPQIVPFRGDYLLLRPERRNLINALIYPVPDPEFPFLGVHSTLRMDGSVWLGPNAVLAFGREGYGRFQINAADIAETLSYPGFQRLARRYWQTGLAELVRDYSQTLFVRAMQRLVPAISAADVLPGPAGIRAQALAADGSLVDDFVINQEGPIIHVRNAPSPAATSSLLIGNYLAEQAIQAFAMPK